MKRTITSLIALASIMLLQTAHAGSFTTEVLRYKKQVNGGFEYKQISPPTACNDTRTAQVMRRKDVVTKLIEDCIVFTAADGTDTTLHCVDDAAPDSGAAFNKLDNPDANANCDITFLAKLAFNGSGAFKRPDGGPTVAVLLNGDSFPAVGAGFGIASFSDADINDNGDVVGLVKTVDLANNKVKALFRCPAGSNCRTTPADLELLAKEGDMDVSGDFEICELEDDTLDAGNDDVVFKARVVDVTGGNCDDPTMPAILRQDLPPAGGAEIVAMKGDAVTPPPAATTIKGFIGGPGVDNTGNVSFIADLIGAVKNRFVIYCDPMCGTAVGAGVVIGGTKVKSMTQVDVADAGEQIAFSAGNGLFSWDPDSDDLSKVAAKGDELAGPGGDNFTVKKTKGNVSISSDGEFVAGSSSAKSATLKPKSRKTILLGDRD